MALIPHDPSVSNKVFISDMPTKKVKYAQTTQTIMDDYAIKEYFDQFKGDIVYAGIERQRPRPGRDLRGQATLSQNYGALRSQLSTSGIPFIEMEPQVWQKKVDYDGTGKDGKTRSIVLATKHFPHVSILRHDIADALLIAYATREMVKMGDIIRESL